MTLHQAAANQAPEALVRLLLDVRPEGAEEKDKVRGRRPVHYAFAPNPHRRVPCTVVRATCMHTALLVCTLTCTFTANDCFCGDAPHRAILQPRFAACVYPRINSDFVVRTGGKTAASHCRRGRCRGCRFRGVGYAAAGGVSRGGRGKGRCACPSLNLAKRSPLPRARAPPAWEFRHVHDS